MTSTLQVLILLLTFFPGLLGPDVDRYRQDSAVDIEIRYHAPEAGEVTLVWGIDGWQTVPEGMRSPETVIRNDVMHTPMSRRGESFIAEINLSSDNILEYGFLITKDRSGETIEPIWDGLEEYRFQPKESEAVQMIGITSAVIIPAASDRSESNLDSIVHQEIRYKHPDANEIYFVWGINGWSLLTPDRRPAGTAIKNNLMYSPMTKDGDVFSIQLEIPAWTVIDYGFMVTKNSEGKSVNLWKVNGSKEGSQLIAFEGVYEAARVDIDPDHQDPFTRLKWLPTLFILFAGAVLSKTGYRILPNRLNKQKGFVVIFILYTIYAAVFIFQTSIMVNGERFYSLFDDGMISMRYAKNLANGDGLIWNPGGEKVEGFTNPLWVIFMAGFHLFPLPESKISLLIQISGFFFLAFNLYFVAKISKTLYRPSTLAAFISVILTAFYLPLNNWGLQGMEVSLLALITTFSAWMSIHALKENHHSRHLYVLLGLSTLIRPDVVVIYLAFFLFSWAAIPTQRGKHFLTAVSFLVLPLLAQTVFRMAYFNEVLPNTYYLKMTGFPILARVGRGFQVFLDFVWKMNIFIFILPILYVINRREKPILLLLFVFVSQSMYSIYIGGDAWEWWGGSNRYISIVMPLFFILLGDVLLRLSEGISQIGGSNTPESSRSQSRAVNYLTLGALTLTCLITTNSIYGPKALQEWLLLERPMLVEENAWSTNTALSIRNITDERAQIAVVYAGTLPYFLDRPSIDLLGKNDAYIAHLPTRRNPNDPGAFYPGHMKWDYSHSIQKLKPDIVVQLWNHWGDQDQAIPYLRNDYKPVNLEGTLVYLREDSTNIFWDNLPAHQSNDDHEDFDEREATEW